MAPSRWDEHGKCKVQVDAEQRRKLQLSQLGIALAGDFAGAHPPQAPAKTAVSVSVKVFFLSKYSAEIHELVTRRPPMEPVKCHWPGDGTSPSQVRPQSG